MDQQFASFWQRIFSGIIDLIILWPLSLASLAPPSQGYLNDLLFYAIDLCYVIFFTTKYGQTIGKMLIGIKVISIDVRPIRLRTVLLREWFFIQLIVCETAIRVYSSFEKNTVGNPNPTGAYAELIASYPVVNYFLAALSALMVIDFVAIAFHPEKRALHDLIAKTRVIRVPRWKLS